MKITVESVALFVYNYIQTQTVRKSIIRRKGMINCMVRTILIVDDIKTNREMLR